MFTDVTYQDWQQTARTAEDARAIVRKYKASTFFRAALEADRYFRGENPTLDSKYLLRVRMTQREDDHGMVTRAARQEEVVGNRISSSFLRRFVCQQNQYLLGNGVTLKDEAQKHMLGEGFDTALQMIGERALLHGVSFGYWNYDHIEPLPAVVDEASGCCALLDELTGEIGAAIQFWQMAGNRPLYLRIFEADGVAIYAEKNDRIEEVEPKRPYRLTVRLDALGETVTGGENYGALPIVPLYANDEKQSELTASIKTKIDAYDRIMSDFGDNLDRANDVYWVLNNFGGSTDQALQMIQEIQRLKIAMTVSDGTNSSSAEPRTIDVPYAARQTALDLLEKALYQDFMALSMSELTGGSLTNVAIQAAATSLNLKCDHYEWQCFAFVQRVLALLGEKSEEIRFKRQKIANLSETVQDIYVMRGDIDRRTALKLNPYISQDEIDGILEALDAEEVTGLPNMEALQKEIDRQQGDDAG